MNPSTGKPVGGFFRGIPVHLTVPADDMQTDVPNSHVRIL